MPVCVKVDTWYFVGSIDRGIVTRNDDRSRSQSGRSMAYVIRTGHQPHSQPAIIWFSVSTWNHHMRYAIACIHSRSTSEVAGITAQPVSCGYECGFMRVCKRFRPSFYAHTRARKGRAHAKNPPAHTHKGGGTDPFEERISYRFIPESFSSNNAVR